MTELAQYLINEINSLKQELHLRDTYVFKPQLPKLLTGYEAYWARENGYSYSFSCEELAGAKFANSNYYKRQDIIEKQDKLISLLMQELESKN